MRFPTFIALSLCAILSSCATYVVPAPTLVDTPIEVNGLRLVNDQLDARPRTYFTDGITTNKTNFRGWTQAFINRLGNRLPAPSSLTSKPKSLAFSIQAITCAGHFVSDCSLSLSVARGDGVRKTYSTESYSGYPLDVALERAIDASIDLVMADADLVRFMKE
jgi:hypothetical protein